MADSAAAPATAAPKLKKSLSSKVANKAAAVRKSLTSPLRRRPSGFKMPPMPTEVEWGVSKTESSAAAPAAPSAAPAVIVETPAVAAAADFVPPPSPAKEPAAAEPENEPVVGKEVPETIVEMVAQLEKESSSPKTGGWTAVAPTPKEMNPLLRMFIKVTCTEMCFTEVEPVRALPLTVSA